MGGVYRVFSGYDDGRELVLLELGGGNGDDDGMIGMGV